jgi:hypothetical protein
MTSGMTAFVVAVGGTSVICYLLMHRVQNRSARPERAGSEGSGTSTGSGGDGWNLVSWFGGDSSSSDNSGTSCDSGSGDSGGGGCDGGGGGGGGGD